MSFMGHHIDEMFTLLKPDCKASNFVDGQRIPMIKGKSFGKNKR